MQEKKSRPPALVHENTTLAMWPLATRVTGCLTASTGPGPHRTCLATRGRPETVPSGSALCPLPVGPSGRSSCGLPCFSPLSISTEGTVSCDPAGRANGRRQDAQGNASRLAQPSQRAPCSPTQRRPRRQRDPSSPASKVGGCRLAPRGPRSVDTGPWRPTAQAQLLALLRRTPAPGWAGRPHRPSGTDS